MKPRGRGKGKGGGVGAVYEPAPGRLMTVDRMARLRREAAWRDFWTGFAWGGATGVLLLGVARIVARWAGVIP